MIYLRKEFRVEEIQNLDALVRILPPKFEWPVLRQTTSLKRPIVQNVEIYDFYTNTYLGNWDEDSFDFAGADDKTIHDLDSHLFQKMWKTELLQNACMMSKAPKKKEFTLDSKKADIRSRSIGKTKG